MATVLLPTPSLRPAPPVPVLSTGGGVSPSDPGAAVIRAALELHRQLGPCLLAVVYEVILARQLRQQGLAVDRQLPVPVTFEGLRWEEGFRADLIVGGRLLVEVVSEQGGAEAPAQRLLTYLRVMGLPDGLLLNFGASDPGDVVHRISHSAGGGVGAAPS